MKVENHIEHITRPMLEVMVNEIQYLAVFFCKSGPTGPPPPSLSLSGGRFEPWNLGPGVDFYTMGKLQLIELNLGLVILMAKCHYSWCRSENFHSFKCHSTE
jgi:hypothetical protein